MASDPFWAGITVTIACLFGLATLVCVAVLVAAWVGSAPFRAGDTELDPEDHNDLGDH